MIPIISQLTDLVDFVIQSLFFVLIKIFELFCNLIECFFKISAILIRLCAKIESLLDSSTLCLLKWTEIFIKFLVIQYERVFQVIISVYSSIDFHQFAITLIFLALFYFIYSRKEFILKIFKKKMIRDGRETTAFENERLMCICCICGVNYRTVLLMPCKHFCMCQFCYNIGYTTISTREYEEGEGSITKITKCPICRSFIYDSISVYN